MGFLGLREGGVGYVDHACFWCIFFFARVCLCMSMCLCVCVCVSVCECPHAAVHVCEREKESKWRILKEKALLLMEMGADTSPWDCVINWDQGTSSTSGQ